MQDEEQKILKQKMRENKKKSKSVDTDARGNIKKKVLQGPSKKKALASKENQTDLKARIKMSRDKAKSKSDTEEVEYLAEYTVAPGDSLSKIAKDYYGTFDHWKLIYETNKSIIGDNPDLIEVGQVYKIPKLPNK